jgi:hypothetical protein
MAPKVKPPTAVEMIKAGGLRNYRRALKFVARYSHESTKAGRLLTLKEYMAARGLSPAMAYKEQQAWRACVGPDVTLLEIVSEAAMKDKGWTEDQREQAIAVFLGGG